MRSKNYSLFMIKNLIFAAVFSLAFSNNSKAQDVTNATSDQTQIIESDLPKTADENKESKLLNGSLSNAIDLGSTEIKSLMMSDEEKENVSRAIDAFKNNQPFIPTINGQSGTIDPDQQALMQKAMEGQTGSQENEKSYIYLASIMYFTPKDWAVWINDKKITPENNKIRNDLYLRSIKQDSVEVRWKLSISKWKILSGEIDESKAPKINQSSEVIVDFTLRPNQTYILSNQQVVEGKAVVALIKKKEADEKNKKK